MTNEICASRGPRIGQEGSPRCAGPAGHSEPHKGYIGSGFENVWWDAPVMRDAEFARDWVSAGYSPED